MGKKKTTVEKSNNEKEIKELKEKEDNVDVFFLNDEYTFDKVKMTRNESMDYLGALCENNSIILLGVMCEFNEFTIDQWIEKVNSDRNLFYYGYGKSDLLETLDYCIDHHYLVKKDEKIHITNEGKAILEKNGYKSNRK